MLEKEHNTLQEIKKIVNYKAPIYEGLYNELKEAFLRLYQ